MTAKFVCPRCKGPLASSNLAYSCATCRSTYPIIAGIADFRVYRDPYIDLVADRQKGLRLAERAQADHLSFAQLVQYYYSITPEVPPDLANYYLNHHLCGVTRGYGLIERMRRYGIALPAPRETLVDLGCGTGGFAAALAQAGTRGRIIAIDLAFRWLVVARRRFEEMGIDNVDLVCACADYLPLADEVATHVTAENLIEHVADQDSLFAEIKRIRAPYSAVLARTVNRFALGPEPHVGVWGVGYLPRSLMNAYVQWRKGIPYEHIHLQSLGELKRTLRASGLSDAQVRYPMMVPDDLAHQSPLRQRLFNTFSSLCANPLLRPFLTQIGPYLEIVAVKKAAVKTPPRLKAGTAS